MSKLRVELDEHIESNVLKTEPNIKPQILPVPGHSSNALNRPNPNKATVKPFNQMDSRQYYSQSDASNHPFLFTMQPSGMFGLLEYERMEWYGMKFHCLDQLKSDGTEWNGVLWIPFYSITYHPMKNLPGSV